MIRRRIALENATLDGREIRIRVAEYLYRTDPAARNLLRQLDR